MSRDGDSAVSRLATCHPATDGGERGVLSSLRPCARPATAGPHLLSGPAVAGL